MTCQKLCLALSLTTLCIARAYVESSVNVSVDSSVRIFDGFSGARVEVGNGGNVDVEDKMSNSRVNGNDGDTRLRGDHRRVIV